jgi:microcystin-dependent protein
MTYLPSKFGPVDEAGTMKPIAHGTVPDGWLTCDGSAVSRTTYAELFAVIGTTWGVGDGSTTSNLPDMQGRVPVGIGGSGVTSVGDTGGEQEHTLTVDEMPSHRHANGGSSKTNSAAYYYPAGSNTTSYTAYAGGDDPHNNMQPYAGVKWVVKT